MSEVMETDSAQSCTLDDLPELPVVVPRCYRSADGIELSNRGRVPAEVIEKYRAAGN